MFSGSPLKLCRGPCGEWKPLEKFSINRASTDGRVWRCKDCEKAYRKANAASIRERSRVYYINNSERIIEQQKEYRAENPDTVKILRRARNLKRKYGLSVVEYDTILEEQSGLCANPGCFNEPSSERSLDVDHDHTCCPDETSCGDCIRGLLCSGCNAALGYIHDDIDRLRGLAQYLEDYSESKQSANLSVLGVI